MFSWQKITLWHFLLLLTFPLQTTTNQNIWYQLSVRPPLSSRLNRPHIISIMYGPPKTKTLNKNKNITSSIIILFQQVEKELKDICNNVLDLLDKFLIAKVDIFLENLVENFNPGQLPRVQGILPEDEGRLLPVPRWGRHWWDQNPVKFQSSLFWQSSQFHSWYNFLNSITVKFHSCLYSISVSFHSWLNSITCLLSQIVWILFLSLFAIARIPFLPNFSNLNSIHVSLNNHLKIIPVSFVMVWIQFLYFSQPPDFHSCLFSQLAEFQSRALETHFKGDSNQYIWYSILSKLEQDIHYFGMWGQNF